MLLETIQVDDHSFFLFSQDSLEVCSKEQEFKSILFSLCYFHACVAGRLRFGPQGWSRRYPFSPGDLTICASVLYNYLEANPNVSVHGQITSPGSVWKLSVFGHCQMDHNFSFEAIIEIADTIYASSAQCENKPDQRFYNSGCSNLRR